jgi:hypothetical protein
LNSINQPRFDLIWKQISPSKYAQSPRYYIL